MGTRLTVPAVQARKVRSGHAPLVMVTAYDAPGARLADAAGVDLLLVGDSLAMVILGHPDTLSVTVDEMVHHTAAVARTSPEALVVADLPWLSYHVSVKETIANAARLIRAGAQAVKLEGGTTRVPMVEALVGAEIPVMGHIGLTPQSVHAQGGFRVQGRTAEAATQLVESAKALQHSGCFALVLEGVPAEVAILVTEAVGVPTIGIGAGIHCDGQVLVYHDLLGLQTDLQPRFVRRYADLGSATVEALGQFAEDVRSGKFPSPEESYSLPPEASAALGCGQFR